MATAIFETQRRDHALSSWLPEEPQFVDGDGHPTASPNEGDEFEVFSVSEGTGQTDAEGWRYATALDRVDTERPFSRAFPIPVDFVRLRMWVPIGASRTPIEAALKSKSRSSAADLSFNRFVHYARNQTVARRRLLSDDALPEAIGWCVVELCSASVPCEAPYVTFRVEATERRTSVLRKHEAHEGFVAPAGATTSFNLPLHSFPSLIDLHIHVFDDLAPCRESPVSRAIVPLRQLLVPSAYQASKLLLGASTAWQGAEQRLRLRLLPSSVRSRRLTTPATPPSALELNEKMMSAIKGVPDSGSIGSPSDLGSLGCIEVSVRVGFSSAFPLWRTLCQAPWQPGKATIAEDMTEEALAAADTFTELDPNTMKSNQDRFVRALSLPPLLGATLQSTFFSACAAIAWVCLAVWCPACGWPWVLLSCVLCNGVFSKKLREKRWRVGDATLPGGVEHRCAYRVWNDQVGPTEVPQGVNQVLSTGYTLFWLQDSIGKGAAAIERMHYLLSFQDPTLSVVVYAACAVFCTSLSLLLWMVSAQYIFACFGAGVVLVSHCSYNDWVSFEDHQFRVNCELLSSNYGFEKAKERVNQELQSSATGLLQSLKMGAGRSLRRKSSFSALINVSQAVNDKLQSKLQNFFARVPTELEVAHQFIATRIATEPELQK